MTTRQFVRPRQVAAALAGVLLTALIPTTTASPARAIHRGDDVPISSYRIMVSLRLSGMPDSHRCGGTLLVRFDA
jgi:hypothetical protein